MPRCEAPEGPTDLLANPEPKVVELWVTKKIKIIFFGLAAAAVSTAGHCDKSQSSETSLNSYTPELNFNFL